MSAADQTGLGNRVLFLAPTARDAALTSEILGRGGITCVSHARLDELCADLERGAGVVLIVEEIAEPDRCRCLSDWLVHQPSWSDLPILVFAHPGADSAAVARAMTLLGNVTVLERPIRVAALVSTVRTALRARARQYEIRDRLTEQAETARQLEQSVAEMQTLLDTLPVGVVIAHDVDARVMTGNRAAARWLKLDRDASIAMRPSDGTPPRFRVRREGVDVDVESLPVRRAARGESIHGEELEFVFDDGTSMHLLVSAMPVYDSSQHTRGAVATLLDITERKRAEASLRDADRRKDDFLAILAHELRNPLAPIRNALQILRLTSGPDPATAGVGEMLERQVNHMVRLVDDLLEVSRITRGKIELRPEPTALDAIVQSAFETSRPLIESAGHTLIMDLPRDPLVVQADPVRIAQVISNLLNNAAKYTDPGGRIELMARREGSSAVITVLDNGTGIDPAKLPLVFELFTQVDRSPDRAQGGLGIGLTLVKTLVEMHGGSVSAHSDGPGRGSAFTIRLPLARARSSTIPRAHGLLRPGVLNASRVLVVDDNRDAAESLGTLLHMLGAEVAVAFDGPSALRAVEEHRPSTVLLDIGMQGMDGYEVARRIRSGPASKDITLVALTGWGQDADRARTRSAGFDHHLVKPASLAALQDVLTARRENSEAHHDALVR